MNVFVGFIGFCAGYFVSMLLDIALSKPTFDHQQFIDVCIQTGGSPRVVEADADGLVMNCLYESTDGTLHYEETRKDARA